MGLDMYLESATRTVLSLERLNEIDNDVRDGSAYAEACSGLEVHTIGDENYNYKSIFAEEVYWRKFNALHAWFVDNLCSGVDNCQRVRVSKEHLQSLFSVLESLDRDDDKARALFAPRAGFFFGSTDIDEYYWEDVELCKRKIQEILDTFDFKNKELFYYASW